MAHNVIEIKGELWSFICENHSLDGNHIIGKYSDLGKTIVKKNFGEKNSLELIGVNEIEIAALQFAEQVYNDLHPRPKLTHVKKYA